MPSFKNFILPRASIGGTCSTERITGAWGGCGKFGFSWGQISFPKNWWIGGSLWNDIWRILFNLWLPFISVTGNLFTTNPVYWVKGQSYPCPPPVQKKRVLSEEQVSYLSISCLPAVGKTLRSLINHMGEYLNKFNKLGRYCPNWILISKTYSSFLSFSSLFWLKNLQKPLHALVQFGTKWPLHFYFQVELDPSTTHSYWG